MVVTMCTYVLIALNIVTASVIIILPGPPPTPSSTPCSSLSFLRKVTSEVRLTPPGVVGS